VARQDWKTELDVVACFWQLLVVCVVEQVEQTAILPPNQQYRQQRNNITCHASVMSQQWLIDEIAHYIVHSDRIFRAKLDKTAEDLERKHREAIEDAQIQHAAILASAKEALDDARRLHAEEVERIRLRNLEALARERQERAARMEYERKIAEAKARAAEIAKREAEAEARAAEIAATAASTPATGAQAVQTVQAVLPINTPSDSHAIDSSTTLMRWDQLEVEHNAYLQLHKKLKDMRKYMVNLYKKANSSKGENGIGNPPIQDMADWRRSIVKLLGQLTSEAAKNRQTASHLLLSMTCWIQANVCSAPKSKI
jgi:hypothetical protein